jgi:phosphatidylethanolamine-binding protein (PEBP) family uncharacterized protein
MLEKLPDGVGHALIEQRAGMEHVVYNDLHARRATARMSVTSRAFAFNARLPTKYTADGEGISPPIAWDDVPAGVESFAMIVDLPPTVGAIDEGDLNSPHHRGAGLDTGRNSFFRQAWLPPDPPPGHGEHRYVFQVFALGPGESFSEAPGRREFLERVLDRALAVGCLIGTYERSEAEPSEVDPEPTAEAGVA